MLISEIKTLTKKDIKIKQKFKQKYYKNINFRFSKTDIQSLILNNKQGFTKVVYGNSRTDGYVVAVKTLFTLTNVYDITQYRDIVIKPVNNYTTALGGWWDGYRYYIEVSVIADNLQDAIRLGKKYKQRAIFDLGNSQEIFI